MLWEVEIQQIPSEIDREGQRVLAEAHALGAGSVSTVAAARSFLVEGKLTPAEVSGPVARLLADGVVERCVVRGLGSESESTSKSAPSLPHNSHPTTLSPTLLNVLFKSGVTDNVGITARAALESLGLKVTAVATCRKYWINADATPADVQRLAKKVLANDAIERVITGPLELTTIGIGNDYTCQLRTVSIRSMNDKALERLSKDGQLYLSLVEMQTIKQHFVDMGREPTDIELETIAQTWSEHCSHKTLAGRIRYVDENGERRFENMLKETVFAATQTLRKQWGADDWCVSVFKDNAGIVTFNDEFDVCIKVETHNHPSALEPYGGANTGLGGVIRDPLGTGLGAKPVCNTDVFCFAPPDTPYESLPEGVLHPRTVMRGVVSGVRDYGNRMGIPTVNGAVFFDDRYLGNPLVYCGNVAIIPVGMWQKEVHPGDFIVAVGGRTGRDGIHGATFSSAELTHESETVSGGAVQIGNAITEKMVMDVILTARDRGLYRAITDCGAGGFSSAVGEMGEETGAEVWLEKAPLKYSGLSYTEIWISEAQERMVLAVPPENWDAFHALCASEGVEATAIGVFTDTHRLVLKYDGQVVGDLAMELLHDGRPPIVREAVYVPMAEKEGLWLMVDGLEPVEEGAATTPAAAPSLTINPKPSTINHSPHTDTLRAILGSLNVCSKESIIRQYDHEVQAGSVVKPLVGVKNDGPSDAAVVQPDLKSKRGLAIACGMNPRLGDLDPYWMAASAIDEAVRNCVAVGADPQRIAILDNFCWGKTDRPETLGSLVRAALACHDTAIAFGTPFVSGKDSLNNEFSYQSLGTRAKGSEQEGAASAAAISALTLNPQPSALSSPTTTISIPASLLITALGQLDSVEQAVTMDLKSAGNVLFLIGETKPELGGSHYALVHGLTGGLVPKVDFTQAPKVFAALHTVLKTGQVRSCHDLSEGGLACAVAEMAFAGGLGVEVTLAGERGGISPPAPAHSPPDAAAIALFSESNTRFIIEVEPNLADQVRSHFITQGIHITQLGTVTNTGRITIRSTDGQTLIDADGAELKSTWQRPLATI